MEVHDLKSKGTNPLFHTELLYGIPYCHPFPALVDTPRPEEVGGLALITGQDREVGLKSVYMPCLYCASLFVTVLLIARATSHHRLSGRIFGSSEPVSASPSRVCVLRSTNSGQRRAGQAVRSAEAQAVRAAGVWAVWVLVRDTAHGPILLRSVTAAAARRRTATRGGICHLPPPRLTAPNGRGS